MSSNNNNEQVQKMFAFPTLDKKFFRDTLEEAEKPSSSETFRPLTELTLSEDIAETLRENFTHSRDLGWMHYDGMRHKTKADVDVQNGLIRQVKTMTVDAFEEFREAKTAYETNKNAENEKVFNRAKAWYDLCMQHQNQRGLEQLTKLEKVHLDTTVPFDTKPSLLVCPNGIVDLRQGILLPHSRDYALTQLSPFCFNPQATCARFAQIVFETFLGDLDLIHWFQKWVGYNFTGEVWAQLWTLWLGKGANGKSLLAQIFASLLGDDYAYHLPKDVITKLSNRSSEAPSPSLMALRAKRFAYVSETESDEKLASSLIKTMVGDKTLTARGHYKDPITFPITFKLNIYTNSELNLSDYSYGSTRRIAVIPFLYTVPEEKRIADLDTLLLESEGEGILNWCVQGAVMCYQEGLYPFPSAIQQATDEYKKHQNPILLFMEDCCERGDDFTAPRQEAYEQFKKWQEETEGQAMTWTRKKFKKSMQETGFDETRDKHGNYYRGFQLQPVTLTYKGSRPLSDVLKEEL